MQRLMRRWQGTFPPWALAGAFAAIMVAMLMAVPIAATASQNGVPSYFGQTFERGVPPDIVVGMTQPQFYIDATSIDTSQGAVCALTIATPAELPCTAPAICSTATSFYDPSDGRIGGSPPHEATLAMQSQTLDRAPATVPIQI